jgi:APA family basic amino acid/polyamine antiporter
MTEPDASCSGADGGARCRAGDERLTRAVGVSGAVLLGLGSIVGTGIFVSLGTAAGVAGPSVVAAVALAAGVATLNGLSSAQLAASHPVSGGTYEYGYRYVSPAAGFLAGWMFLCAKSASAATAALGFAGYTLTALGVGGATARVALGVVGVAAVTGLVAGGIGRSSRANALIVSLTLLALCAFVAAGLPGALAGARDHLRPFFGGEDGVGAFLHGAALMFVAFTGYGRVATLGEEVRDPERSIPLAIGITLLVSMALYVAVGFVAVAAVGADALARATEGAAAPLEVVARGFGIPGVAGAVALGAVTAMLGVLLNLVLGLSRVWLAMARRGDAPRSLARISEAGSPRRAVVLTGLLVGGLTLTGSVRLTWSFSAFTVLVYYALTNLAALRLPPGARRYPRSIPAAGLAACLGLAFWVEARIWVAGLALAAAGLGWHAWRARRSRSDPEPGS